MLVRWGLLFSCLPFVAPTQVPWRSASSTTLVDVLSADPDYTSLIRLLQRARLIPTLNKLNGSTLFAPTNDAIKKRSVTDHLWSAVLGHDEFIVTDNVREKLRQELFYHLLNYSLSEPPQDPRLNTLKTLLFPHKTDNPPSDPPPWIPEPSGTLGGEPQRLRMFSQSGGAFVGVDAFGKGGAEVVKGLAQAGNGVVFGLSEVLNVPPDLGEYLMF
jgi:solute carrier family 25 carnitine/acylcarnitine transporter 20/29